MRRVTRAGVATCVILFAITTALTAIHSPGMVLLVSAVAVVGMYLVEGILEDLFHAARWRLRTAGTQAAEELATKETRAYAQVRVGLLAMSFLGAFGASCGLSHAAESTSTPHLVLVGIASVVLWGAAALRNCRHAMHATGVTLSAFRRCKSLQLG